MGQLIVGLIRIYQIFISPLLPPSCRFYPSCSRYTVESVQRHGAVFGLGLGALRLLKCHPWHPGGVDPVPERLGARDWAQISAAK